MEEINAWGAYEAGTAQNARSLGRSAVRQRRVTSIAAGDPSSSASAAAARNRKAQSSHALFFGTDDVAALMKKADAEVPTDDDTEAIKEEESTEWTELCSLARDVFRVYFSMDDSASAADTSRMKQVKKRGIHRKVNGTMPYLTAYLKGLQLPAAVVQTILFVEASFRGIAQVYFQNNPLSGVLILTGLFVQSTRVALHGIIAIIAGNLAGLLMGFDKSFLSCGLFGYNSFLVGLALATFYSPEKHGGWYWPVAVGAIVFAYFSSVLFVMLGKILSPYKTPPFTLPFNISTIFWLLAMGGMNNVDMVPVREPELPSYETEPVAKLTVGAFFAGSIRGVGQVFLANDLVSGCLVLIGIMLCSRISALAAFVGSAIGAGVAALVGCNRDAIENGMYGFNPSLTLTAMLMFYVPSVGSISVGAAASIITVFIQLALATSLEPTGLPYMTLPFCLAALAFIVIQGTTSNVISVPLSSMTTPEDHLKRVRRLSHGFELLYGAIRSSSYKGNHCRRNLIHRTTMISSRMNSAFSDYDQAVNGEEEKGFLSRMIAWFNAKKESRAIEGGSAASMQQQSFRMSWAVQSSFVQDTEKDAYDRMFRHIDAENEYQISKAQFKTFLQSVGLSDPLGLDFACEAFQLMDLDQSGDIDPDEFIAFAKISRHMPEIRRLVVKFFTFVDVNGDHAVEIRELDDARAYLGLPPLSVKDQESLAALCNENEELEFEVIVNFVTIFKLKAIVKEYQDKRNKGFSLDDSIRSSVKGSSAKGQ